MKTIFTTISSQNNEELIVNVGRPRDNCLNLFLSFNPFLYRELIDALDGLSYAELIKVSAYEDEQIRGGIGIRLLEDNCFVRFIEDLPEIICKFVDTATPSNFFKK